VSKNDKATWVAKPAAPDDLVRNMLATPNPHLPVMNRILEAPILSEDGMILDKPGYSAPHQAFYIPNPELQVPKIRPRPSKADISRAVELVTVELLGDFPFVADADLAHAFCLFELPFVRNAIPGATPLHLVEAPTEGTGKGLLVDVCTWPALGADPTLMPPAGSEAEWKKQITATLRTLPRVILIDNLDPRRMLSSNTLSSALTRTSWEDRELGYSHNLFMPNLAVWTATGNNPKASTEMLRREVRSRIDAGVENPHDRSGFRYDNLRQFVADNRGDFIWAGLTLGRAWFAAGRPTGDVTLGSFEAWAKVMGGICEVAGISGFLGNLQEMREQNADELHEWYEFLRLCRERFGDSRFQTRDLGPEAVAALGCNFQSDTWARSVGKIMSGFRDRPIRSLVLRQAGLTGGAVVWRVEKKPRLRLVDEEESGHAAGRR
jgi:hypothetical protein